MHQPTLLTTLAAVLATVPSAQAGIYTKNSPVLQLDHKNFNDEIMKTNYTSIVEFYAPWCGHCQNLKPAYEKAAKNLDGLAKVAAIDCDDDANKQICGTYGIQGFPTLKTFKPGSKKYPIVEDYRGQRTASGITDEVVNKINNHVTRVTGKDIDNFLAMEGPKALLFTEKGTTSALLRSIAIDYLTVINVGQVRNKESEVVEKFGVQKFPTLVLIPEGEGAEPIVYDGELKKEDMVNFLKQAGEPNPDPKPKDSKKSKKKAEPEPEPAPEEAPESSSATSTTENAASTSIPIETITSSDMLEEKCLQPKSHTCLLALVTSDSSDNGEKLVESLSKLNAKYIHGKRHLFPFFALPGSIDSTASVRSALELSGDVELIALNARRSWWRQYEGDFSVDSVEAWIDAIRMGEGGKKKLPVDILTAKTEEPKTEEAASGETKATDPEPEIETEAPEADEKIVHGEL